LKSVISLKINGQFREVVVSQEDTLLEVLRDNLQLTGTKAGCEKGTCGACTVLVDGEPFLSCLTLAMDAVDREIVTIEGLNQEGELHPLQISFIESGAVQCGFCTPGMILTAKAILDDESFPSEETVRQRMGGNLCRCTGYGKIVAAIMATAEKPEDEGFQP
jgi:carbon-monoxide dehydrogenase small subunit